MTPNSPPTTETFIVAPARSLVEYGDPVVPFVAIQLRRVRAPQENARQALQLLKDSTRQPIVSVSVGAGDGLSEQSLQKLGLQPLTAAILTELDVGQVRDAVEDDHHRDAEYVRAEFHEDGDVWLSIRPKYGDGYEANVSDAVNAVTPHV